jgi:maleylacetate reductase
MTSAPDTLPAVLARGPIDGLAFELDDGPTIEFGRGALATSAALRDLPAPVGIVASRGRLAAARAAGLEPADAVVFDDIRPHATATLCAAADERLAAARAVIAVGGGSAIGIAKAVAAARGCELAVLATTYSGSEMTSLYGVTEDGVKTVTTDRFAMPKVVIYDPSLTDSLPRRAGDASLMNCLGHLFECGWNAGPADATRVLAEVGVRQVAAGLSARVDGAEETAKDHLMLAGMCGGMTLASGTIGVHHAICHAVGGLTGSSHGEINAVVLPPVMGALRQVIGEAQEELAVPLHDLLDGDCAAHETVARLRDRWGLPARLREVGLAAADVGRVVDQVDGQAVEGGLGLERERLASLLEEIW